MENKAKKPSSQIHTKHITFRILAALSVLLMGLVACKIGGGDCDGLDVAAQKACLRPAMSTSDAINQTNRQQMIEATVHPMETLISNSITPTP